MNEFVYYLVAIAVFATAVCLTMARSAEAKMELINERKAALNKTVADMPPVHYRVLLINYEPTAYPTILRMVRFLTDNGLSDCQKDLREMPLTLGEGLRIEDVDPLLQMVQRFFPGYDGVYVEIRCESFEQSQGFINKEWENRYEAEGIKEMA